MASTNDQRLKQVLVDILLIDDHQYRNDFGPKQIETWDSLAMLNIATGVEQEFGFILNQREMLSLGTIGDIKSVLRARGVEFDS